MKPDDPRLKNLRPFKKGDERNRRGGRPKGVTNSKKRLLRLLELTNDLQNPVTGELEGFSILEQMDLAQILKARKGDTRAYNAILDRFEGKPDQKISVSPHEVNEALLELEQTNYAELARQAQEQMVATEQPVQDQKEDRSDTDVQAEPDPTATHS